MNKRERLEKTILGEATDRVPVALWRHFPGDNKRSADLARSTIEFQQNYGWDFVRIMPSVNFSVIDYGVQESWQGAVDGCCQLIKTVIRRSLDWTEIRTLEPSRGEMGKYLECIRLVYHGLKDDSAPILATIYSPLAQAASLAGRDLLFRNLRSHADRLRTGLNIITESTIRLLEAIRRLPIDGVFYVTKFADYSELNEAEYIEFGRPYDKKLLELIPNNWQFNGIQIQGQAPMLHLFNDFPVQILNWEDQDTRPSLERGQAIFKGAVCGGLSDREHLQLGTPAIIRDTVRQLIQSMNSRRCILTTGNSMPIISPLSNIRAVRDAVESAVL